MIETNVAQSVIHHGLELGADFAEIYVERNLSNLISTLSDRVQSVESGIDFGIGLRLIYGHKVLYGYTNQTDEDELHRILSELAAKDLRDPQATATAFDFTTIETKHPAAQTLSDHADVDSKVAYLLAANRAAKASSNQISQTRGMCKQREQHVAIFNSEGLATEDRRHYIRATLTAIAADGSEQATGQWGDGGLLGWEISEQLDPEKTGQEAARQALVNLGAKPCPSGRMPVVIGPGFGGVIFHEACGHLLETTQIERGTTPFADKVGESIAHSAVTAIDEGLSNGAFGSLSMDDEGMEPQRTVLIKDGVLQRFISDRAGELRTGHQRTGSGRRQSHSFAAASRMRNTYIDAGPHTPEELIASVDHGLYCKAMGGGSVGPTGQFNFSVEEGYLIKDGQLTRPVKGATLIGEAKEVMPRISMCANDLDLAAGFCGSVSGSIFVTVGQPHVKVESITVGGR